MPDDTTLVETPEVTPAAQSWDDVLAAYATNAPVSTPGATGEETAPQTPEVVPTPQPVPETPTAPATTPEPPITGAARRVKEKTHRESLQKQIDELTDYKNRFNETSTKYTELEAVLKEKETKLKETEDWYRNEATNIKFNPMELPEVQQAGNDVFQNLETFIPVDLSSEEESPLPIHQKSFVSTNGPQIHKLVKDWSSISEDEKATMVEKGQMQHVLLSTFAMKLGVPEDHFEEKEIAGRQFRVIDPKHPVYRHLKNNIPGLVQSTLKFERLRDTATKNGFETANQIIRQKMETSKSAWKAYSPGEAEKSPESVTAKAVLAMKDHPEILEMLQREMEAEAIVNGHARMEFDIAEADPVKRTQTGRMLENRWKTRAVNAPLVEPLKKLAVVQQDQITRLQGELAAAKLEIESLSLNGEVGTATPGTNSTPAPVPDAWSDEVAAKYFQNAG